MPKTQEWDLGVLHMFQDGENRNWPDKHEDDSLRRQPPLRSRVYPPPKKYSLGQVYSVGHPGIYRTEGAENRPRKKAAPVLICLSSYLRRGLDICSAK